MKLIKNCKKDYFEKEKINLKQNGITLVALVVTIIVLLILAGISLSLVVGNNGVVKKAQQAIEETEFARKKEEEEFKRAEATMMTPWNGSIAESFAGGIGTQSDPYIVNNGEQLAYLAQQVNSGTSYEGQYIEITQSINLGNIKWTPIGVGSQGDRDETVWNMPDESNFRGILNGNNNVITGINIEEPNMHGVGLIGVLSEEGVVENIYMDQGKILGRSCVGGIVGASTGTVRNCINYAEVIAEDNDSNDSGQFAGGIIGWMYAGLVEDCTNTASVITKDDLFKVSRGKICGRNCWFYGTISG